MRPRGWRAEWDGLSMRFHLRPRWIRRLLTAVAFAWAAGPAAAEVHVTKTNAGALVVEAHDATVRQVLEALSTSNKIVFRDSPALSRVITGTYSGTLDHVLSRVLDG